MSETTDPTAGEGCEVHVLGRDEPSPWCAACRLTRPATPDAEMLAKGLSEDERTRLARAIHGAVSCACDPVITEVERIVAAREAAARAEERERIAQAIEADANGPRKGSINHRAYAGHFAAIARGEQ